MHKYQLHVDLEVRFLEPHPRKPKKTRHVSRYFRVRKLIELPLVVEVSDTLCLFGFEQRQDRLEVGERRIYQGEDIVSLMCGKECVVCTDMDYDQAVKHIQDCGWGILKSLTPEQYRFSRL